ncbi:MAG: pilus assembly PilX N-terminal domain-containing protein [Acidobacteria bacterium]|nr:pilus assembly PilX N-terminal domain-containing protein [Acidobacteriota bacterium]
MDRFTKTIRSEDGVAVVITILVAVAISVIGLSLILITETDTKVAMATQINKENLNVGDGGLRYALNVLRQKPTAGYLDYPWEAVLPPTTHVRQEGPDADTMLSQGNWTLNRQSTSGAETVYNVVANADDFDATTSPVLTDMTGTAIQNVPMITSSSPSQSQWAASYSYYTVFLEAIQGDSDWNSPGTPGSSDGTLDEYDFDKYAVQVRVRVVGRYGSVKDIVMAVELVNPDGTPYGDVPGSQQGGTGGPPIGQTVGFGES